MMLYQITHFKGFKFLIYFVLTVIGFAIIFDYMGIQLNNKMILAILAFGVLIAGMISMYTRGIFHQGHLPVLMGIAFIAVGGLMFWGTLTYTYTDDEGRSQIKEQLWDLTPQESGVFILLIIVGISSTISGFKTMMGASYFWGMSRR